MSEKFIEQESAFGDEERTAICDAVEKTSSTTQLLLVLSEYLEFGGNDEIGAELLEDFAKVFSEHEEKIISEKEALSKESNKLLN